MNIYTDCANYASDTCPCELAENGMCIVCSMCRGEEFCSCKDTVSYCILQELTNNNGHAKNANRSFKCEVIAIDEWDRDYRLLKVRLPEENSYKFKALGGYAFIRTRENLFYDCPVSVFYELKSEDNILGFLVHISGIKTEQFRNVKIGDGVFIRGPYYNSVQGKRQIFGLKNSRAVIIARGMGILPSSYVIDVLLKNNNTVDVYFDKGYLGMKMTDMILGQCPIPVKELEILDKEGHLTEALKELIDTCEHDQTGLIHLGMSDYPIRNIAEYISKEYGTLLTLSCDNNANMCCGEGICGACSRHTLEGRTVHLCKEQMNVYEYGKLL